jgi:hypothetical protein
MSSKTTFAEISPSEFGSLYQKGMSIDEIASELGRSYGYTRNRLLNSGVKLRSKAEGTRMYISTHPEWSLQFTKYHIAEGIHLTEEKVLLLTMVQTEGYTDRTSFGFTNAQHLLHDEFNSAVRLTYGDVQIGRNKLTSRVSSVEMARDLAHLLPGKVFHEDLMRFILDSPSTIPKVLRIVANTEGAILISIKRAKRNYTVESRIVLASSNTGFAKQVGVLLDTIGIRNHLSKLGVIINRKDQIARFVQMVGFSPGVKVMRARAGMSVWLGYEKVGLENLFLRISDEQKRARASGLKGAFSDCVTRQQTLGRLRKWYAEVNGGGGN